jgi:hypothetical protein
LRVVTSISYQLSIITPSNIQAIGHELETQKSTTHSLHLDAARIKFVRH